MSSATHHEHKSHAPKSSWVHGHYLQRHADPHTDTSGQLIQKLLKEQGHTVAAYHLVKDEPSKIKAKIKAAVTNKKIQAIIINGGTGISRAGFDVRSGGCDAGKATGGIRRSLSLSHVSGHRLSGDHGAEPPPASSKAACSSQPPAQKTPSASRWKSSSFRSSATSSKNSPSNRVSVPQG